MPGGSEATRARAGRRGAGAPGGLRHRDFRLFWGGQLVADRHLDAERGTGWLVLELTHSPFQLGLVTALRFTPILLLGRRRRPERPLRQAQHPAGDPDRDDGQAFVLALLVWSGHVRYWHVAVLAVVYGLGRAMDIPARQAFLTDLVGRRDLPNAVALNSVVFNGARIVGPAVAGLLIARFGVTIAFVLNGVSFGGRPGRARGDQHGRTP
jgi:MFS family permease